MGPNVRLLRNLTYAADRASNRRSGSARNLTTLTECRDFIFRNLSITDRPWQSANKLLDDP